MATTTVTTARVLTLVLLLTTIGCDRVTKHLAHIKLAGTPTRSYLNDTFRLEYAENPGGFLSMGEKLPPRLRTALLTVGAGIGVVAVAVMAVRFLWSGLPLIGAVLFVAGGLSNVVDRVMRGSVVDFMNVGVGSLRTGIFNVADVALMVGIALIALGSHYAKADVSSAQDPGAEDS